MCLIVSPRAHHKDASSLGPPPLGSCMDFNNPPRMLFSNPLCFAIILELMKALCFTNNLTNSTNIHTKDANNHGANRNGCNETEELTADRWCLVGHTKARFIAREMR